MTVNLERLLLFTFDVEMYVVRLKVPFSQGIEKHV